MKSYEIWDTETGNIIGAWGTQAQALDVVRDAAQRNGESAIDDLALILEVEDGESRLIAEGSALLALSRTALRAASL